MRFTNAAIHLTDAGLIGPEFQVEFLQFISEFIGHLGEVYQFILAAFQIG